jgi:hypothetical protein
MSSKATLSLSLIKLQVLLFNLNFSQVVYNSKLIAFGASIIGGFGAFQLLDTNIPFVLVYGLFFLEGNFVYNLIFNRAFKIPERVKEVKMGMIAGSSEWGVKARKEEVRRFVRSTQVVGIQAGGFNVMERESTLIFTNFGIQQIVSLLLAF